MTAPHSCAGPGGSTDHRIGPGRLRVRRGDHDHGAVTTSVTEGTTTSTTVAPSTTSSSPTTSSVVTSESSTTTEASSTTTEALSSAETRLPNGNIKAMGYIDEVWEEGGTRYISIDYAEMLTGQEAMDAAVEAGYIAPGEDLPNDYFIRNDNPQKREFTVADVRLHHDGDATGAGWRSR